MWRFGKNIFISKQIDMAEAPKLKRYVRKAGEKDLPDVMKIWEVIAAFHEGLDNEYKRNADTSEQFKQFFITALSRQDACVYLAIDKVEIVGYIVGEIETNSTIYKKKLKGVINEVGVIGGNERKDLMGEMVQALLDWFEAKDIHKVEVSSHIRNDKSIEIWRELGFYDYNLLLSKTI